MGDQGGRKEGKGKRVTWAPGANGSEHGRGGRGGVEEEEEERKRKRRFRVLVVVIAAVALEVGLCRAALFVIARVTDCAWDWVCAGNIRARSYVICVICIPPGYMAIW